MNERRFGRRWQPTLKLLAQAELEGISHYCDDDTLRFFNARINYVCDFCDGKFLAIIESVAPPNSARCHRAVVFDNNGVVVYRSGGSGHFKGLEIGRNCKSSDYGFSTQKSAKKDLDRVIDLLSEMEVDSPTT